MLLRWYLFLKIQKSDMLKRLFDVIFSTIGIILALPIMIVISFLIKKDSKGPIFYKATRVGKHGRVFKMYKFRSMIVNAEKVGGPSTSADDPRMTRIGGFMRKYKIDELPQFINILKGDMSFVGPRPEVPSEVETYTKEEKDIILSVTPGMTDLASLADLGEEEILRGSADPHQTYREKIKPQKLKLQQEYIKTKSFLLDIKILLWTILQLLKK